MLSSRMPRELRLLSESPAPGIAAWPRDESCMTLLDARIAGPPGSPYEGGSFRLEVGVPDRYPFEPPKVKFLTPIYHANIDAAGRICLDTLKMPPSGAWTPSLNISTVLSSIALLMGHPNPDDGLVAEIAEHCQRDRAGYDATAREWTRRYAMDGDVPKQETKPSSSSRDGTDDDSSDDDSREGAPSERPSTKRALGEPASSSSGKRPCPDV
ncbi:UBC core domain-containing protein [Plasmodiophora brassicae]|uniref:E2 ubiquitin-conjugating enzyme n=1 Tax=Plasmodiophora brassicae TaxID=37360 RepID=A0A0G4J0A3_PLABS|nr:hypothetical protein PBRA_008254 [Plasmodiophora brassicae]SPR00961.1 unnamed protein product [Plasmodiophora brassicae]